MGKPSKTLMDRGIPFRLACETVLDGWLLPIWEVISNPLKNRTGKLALGLGGLSGLLL